MGLAVTKLGIDFYLWFPPLIIPLGVFKTLCLQSFPSRFKTLPAIEDCWMTD